MKRYLLAVVAGVIVATCLITAAELARAAGSPASPVGFRWYKGNYHTHSFWSDGNEFPEVINDWYKRNGYDWLGLSDHNTLNAGEKWVKDSVLNGKNPGVIERYEAKYGKKWVERRGTGKDAEVRLKTLEEYRGRFEETGKFLLVQAEEISDKFLTLPVHRNAMNLVEPIAPKGGNSVTEVIRNNLQQVLEQEKRTGVPMLAHLNHPNFKWGVTAEDMAPVKEERFFEVYNGHPGVGHTGDETHASVERIWDIVNTLRIAQYKYPPIYGTGTDDSHKYNTEGLDPEKRMKASITGRGWCMVRAKELTPAALVNAMKAGDFYASSGVTLKDVQFDARTQTLTIDIAAEPGVTYITEFIGTPVKFDPTAKPYLNDKGQELVVTRQYSADVGKVFAKVQGPRATYKLTGGELYVRATVTSSKPPAEPSFEGQKAQAWTQPVGWQKHVK